MDAQFTNSTMQLIEKRENQNAQAAEHKKGQIFESTAVSKMHHTCEDEEDSKLKMEPTEYGEGVRAVAETAICCSGWATTFRQRRGVNLVKKSEDRTVKEIEEDVQVFCFYRISFKFFKF